jgi:hypothetical protein
MMLKFSEAVLINKIPVVNFSILAISVKDTAFIIYFLTGFQKKLAGNYY